MFFQALWFLILLFCASERTLLFLDFLQTETSLSRFYPLCSGKAGTLPSGNATHACLREWYKLYHTDYRLSNLFLRVMSRFYQICIDLIRFYGTATYPSGRETRPLRQRHTGGETGLVPAHWSLRGYRPHATKTAAARARRRIPVAVGDAGTGRGIVPRATPQHAQRLDICIVI